MDFNTVQIGMLGQNDVIIGEGLSGVMHYDTSLVSDFARSGRALFLNGNQASVYKTWSQTFDILVTYSVSPIYRQKRQTFHISKVSDHVFYLSHL